MMMWRGSFLESSLIGVLERLQQEYALLAEFIIPGGTGSELGRGGKAYSPAPIALHVLDVRLQIEDYIHNTTIELGVDGIPNQTAWAFPHLITWVRDHTAQISIPVYEALTDGGLALIRKCAAITGTTISKTARTIPRHCPNCQELSLWLEPNTGEIACGICTYRTYSESFISEMDQRR